MSLDFDSAALQMQHEEDEYDQEDYAREQEVKITCWQNLNGFSFLLPYFSLKLLLSWKDIFLWCHNRLEFTLVSHDVSLIGTAPLKKLAHFFWLKLYTSRLSAVVTNSELCLLSGVFNNVGSNVVFYAVVQYVCFIRFNFILWKLGLAGKCLLLSILLHLPLRILYFWYRTSERLIYHRNPWRYVLF